MLYYMKNATSPVVYHRPYTNISTWIICSGLLHICTTKWYELNDCTWITLENKVYCGRRKRQEHQRLPKFGVFFLGNFSSSLEMNAIYWSDVSVNALVMNSFDNTHAWWNLTRYFHFEFEHPISISRNLFAFEWKIGQKSNTWVFQLIHFSTGIFFNLANLDTNKHFAMRTQFYAWHNRFDWSEWWNNLHTKKSKSNWH